MEELIIDESNFSQYFFDVRKNNPKEGQVMASYTANAELVDGNLKKDIIYLLATTDKYQQCISMLERIGFAEHREAVRICKEIAEDLKNGMMSAEIRKKPYKYKLQAFYYVEKQHIPQNDPHWSYVEIKNIDNHIEKIEHYGKGVIKSILKTQ